MDRDNQWGFWKFWRESLRFYKLDFDVTNLFAVIGAYRRFKKIEKKEYE